jgi:hypothetical protein
VGEAEGKAAVAEEGVEVGDECGGEKAKRGIWRMANG